MADLSRGFKVSSTRDLSLLKTNDVRIPNVMTDSSKHNEFARREFNRKRKVIIRNTPVVSYAVSHKLHAVSFVALLPVVEYANCNCLHITIVHSH
jgi:hypothetical protein